MTRGQESTIGERVAIVETKLDAMDAGMKSMAAKIDLLLEGQAKGSKDRADLRVLAEGLDKKVDSMQPDIETVKDAKRIVKVGAWVAAAVSAVVTTAWAGWSWFIQNFQWR